MNHICSKCKAVAYYDGRCGDGPILLCNCDKDKWIDDGKGGYYANESNAKPVQTGENWSREDD